MIPILVVFVVKMRHHLFMQLQSSGEKTTLAGSAKMEKSKPMQAIRNWLFFSLNISGVALLLNGLRSLRHVVYDVMSDVLTYIDFNTSDLILPKLELRYAFCLLSVASLSCIANLNVLLIFLVANLQNRALSLHGVIVLQSPGAGLQAVPTCRVALVGLSPLL